MHLILYDGVCALCNGSVRWVLRHDTRDVFRFAPLQGPLAARVLSGSRAANELRTVYVVSHYDTSAAQILSRARAVRFVLDTVQPRGMWKLLHAVVRITPIMLLNWGYDHVARLRYRVFGRYDVCPIPPREHRHRFLN
jgi:predicted DCC family thiol-disulfide oxidoreductase YuxK